MKQFDCAYCSDKKPIPWFKTACGLDHHCDVKHPDWRIPGYALMTFYEMFLKK